MQREGLRRPQTKHSVWNLSEHMHGFLLTFAGSQESRFFQESGLEDLGARKTTHRSKGDGSEGQRPRVWDKGKELVPAEGGQARHGFSQQNVA